MISSSERDIQIIKKILIYCKEVDMAIVRFGTTYEEFISDFAFFNSVSMSEMQIGELVKGLSGEFLEQHDNIPWHEIRSMRNWFAHSYRKMNKEFIWNVATMDIPALRKFCESVLNSQ